MNSAIQGSMLELTSMLILKMEAKKTCIDGMKDTQINGIIILDSSLPEIGITNKRKFSETHDLKLFYGGDINMNSKFHIYTCI